MYPDGARETFEQLLSEVHLGSVDSSKYHALIRWTQTFLPVKNVAFKSIREAKNAPNRVREAAARPLDLLVVLVDPEGGVRTDNMVRLVAKSVGCERSVTAGLVRVAGVAPTYTLVGGSESLVAAVKTIFGSQVVAALPSGRTSSVAPLHLAFPCSIGPGDLRTSLASSLDIVPGRIVVKAVTHTKNARNRMAEARGRDPAVVVLVAEGLAASVVADAVRARVGDGCPVLVAEQTPGGWNLSLVAPPVPLASSAAASMASAMA